jgi:hypothetical protein
MRLEYREHEPPGERWDWETYGPDEDIPERYVAADRARADAERARLRHKAWSAQQVDGRLTYERMRAAEQVEARRAARVEEWTSRPARHAEHDDGTEAVA